MSRINRVIIGSNPNGHGNSAVLVLNINQEEGRYISENRVCYWVRNAYLEIDLIIYKDTPEGLELTALLDNIKIAPDSIPSLRGVIETWLEQLTLKKAPVDLLRNRISEALQNRFEDGQADKAQQVRDVLGIK